jgi:hypothetical protein
MDSRGKNPKEKCVFTGYRVELVIRDDSGLDEDKGFELRCLDRNHVPPKASDRCTEFSYWLAK